MDNLIGKRLDGLYEVQELIGSGGMANVYKAVMRGQNGPVPAGTVVAVKVLRREYMHDPDLVRRFKNESKAISLLNHPNIVKVYDVSVNDHLQYIVMEYVDGMTLREYLNERGGKLSSRETVHFISQILKALEHAHANGIVHRDIKPQNIMLLDNGQLRMMDFGIARISRADNQMLAGKAMGSVHYISPEQAKGDETDRTSDIYSVGVMMYEMLSGHLPFDADDVVEVAIGADLCVIEEAADFLEEVPEKHKFMVTSCCPSWSDMVKKLFPQFEKNISVAFTPMVLTARMIKRDHPDCKVVFVGPCDSKKLEARRQSVRSDVDFVLTFEEALGIFAAKGMDKAFLPEDEEELSANSSRDARCFAYSGGVAQAVVNAIHDMDPDREVKVAAATGLADCRKLLMMAKAGKYDGYLLEGMACPGGCIAGAGTLRPIEQSHKEIEAFSSEACFTCANDTPYMDYLPLIEEKDKIRKL